MGDAKFFERSSARLALVGKGQQPGGIPLYNAILKGGRSPLKEFDNG
jgi:hypothetical protein